MIHLTEITVAGQSAVGAFSGSLALTEGLQVISAPNSYGKSLAATAIAWCLGIEPIYGLTDNDPTCFPVAAREEIDLEGHPSTTVLSSLCSISLSHEDGRRLKLTRDIKGDPAVIRVEEHSADGEVRRSKLMARRLAMQDEHGGFQRFLFEWLKWPRQPVLTFTGNTAEVYLENLAPLFYIDQDEGWTDLQSLQISRYGQQQIADIAVEYLLGAIDAIEVRVARQRAVLRDAALRETARDIGERVTAFFRRNGWASEWSGQGSIEQTLGRWSLRTLRELLAEDADVDLAARRKALEAQAEGLRNALTSEPIDPADVSSARSVSQRVVDLKRRRHELNEQLRTLQMQRDEFDELVSSLEHRIHSARDVLRLKTTGVGRLESTECPTCHRLVDPATFALTVQSEQEVASHIESLTRDRELIASNVKSIYAHLTTTQAEMDHVDVELRNFERSLMTVNAAIGTLREQLAKRVSELTAVERAIDHIVEIAAEMDDLQVAIRAWVAEAQKVQQISQAVADVEARKNVFLEALRQYLIALGHSALRGDNSDALRLDERYIPYLETRRLRSLGSASDQSRLIAAYALALAAASNQIAGLHPGFVVLDEPLQQNPDDPHRDLFISFLCKQLARDAKSQTIIFTFLHQAEIDVLIKQGTNVVGPEGSHFLKLQPPPIVQADLPIALPNA